MFHVYADSKAYSREDILYYAYFEGDVYPLYSLPFYIFLWLDIPRGPRPSHR